MGQGHRPLDPQTHLVRLPLQNASPDVVFAFRPRGGSRVRSRGTLVLKTLVLKFEIFDTPGFPLKSFELGYQIKLEHVAGIRDDQLFWVCTWDVRTSLA